MFIVDPAKGGYQGDVVNTSFRKGRQDAYRDYVDNYNFAVTADAANNAENQKNVERTANNYDFQNKMRQGARAEAINFVTDNSKLDDAIVGNEINRHKNDYVWPKAPELGESQGIQFVAKQVGDEGKARGDAAVAKDYGNNPRDFIDANHAKAQSQALNNAATEAKTDATNASTGLTNAQRVGQELENKGVNAIQDAAEKAAAAQEKVDNYRPVIKQAEDAVNEVNNISDETWRSIVLNGMVAQRQAEGDTKSEAEIAQEIQANPQFNAQVEAYKRAEIRKREDAYNAAWEKNNAHNQELNNANNYLKAARLGSTRTNRGSSSTASNGPEIKENNLNFDKDNPRAFTIYVEQSNGKFLNAEHSIGLVGSSVIFPSGLKRTYPSDYTENDIRKAEGLPSLEETNDKGNAGKGNANKGNIMGN